MLWADGDLAAVDCLISDIAMPDTDGFALQIARSRPSQRGMRI
jgi:hypothetical protein